MVVQTAVFFPDKDTCTLSCFKQFDSRITHPAFPLLRTIKSLTSAEMVLGLVKPDQALSSLCSFLSYEFNHYNFD